MRPVSVRIDQIAVDIGADMHAGEVESTLRVALALLASRLASAPLGLGRDGPREALDLLELDPLAADWIAGPAAAARLADEIYRRIVGAAA
ncbi:MAG TPA: hypothetical protein VIU11_14975 [Nakamurella sp.]